MMSKFPVSSILYHLHSNGLIDIANSLDLYVYNIISTSLHGFPAFNPYLDLLWTEI